MASARSADPCSAVASRSARGKAGEVDRLLDAGERLLRDRLGDLATLHRLGHVLVLDPLQHHAGNLVAVLLDEHEVTVAVDADVPDFVERVICRVAGLAAAVIANYVRNVGHELGELLM